MHKRAETQGIASLRSMYYSFFEQMTSFFLEVMEKTRVNVEMFRLKVVGFFKS